MDARGEAEKSLEGRHRGTPPVEAEGELVQVGLEVVVADAVVGAARENENPAVSISSGTRGMTESEGRPFRP